MSMSEPCARRCALFVACLPISASVLPPFRLHLHMPCIGCGHFKETCNKKNNLCLRWKFKRDPKRWVPGVDKKSLPEVNSLLTLVCAIIAYELGVGCCMGSQSKSCNAYTVHPSIVKYLLHNGEEATKNIKNSYLWDMNHMEPQPSPTNSSAKNQATPSFL